MTLAVALLLIAAPARAITSLGFQPPYQVATSSPNAVVSLGNVVGKTNVLKTGSLTTTAKTQVQVVLTYTVTTGKTLYVGSLFAAAASTVSASQFVGGGNDMGSGWWESPSGTAISSYNFVSSSGPATIPFDPSSPAEPTPITSGTVLRYVVTPNSGQTIRWIANFVGYEK